MTTNLFQKIPSFKSLLPLVVILGLALILTVVHIFGSFKGMQHREAMEAASLGRELIRGNGLENKVIYPVALYNKNSEGESIPITNHQNTYTAPGAAIINAGVLSLIDGGDFAKHQVKPGNHVYTPDRALALASVAFMFVGIFFSYKLVKTIFDAKLANTLAFILLMSGSMWQYAQSCLPQMFLFMLFSMIIWLL